MYPYRVAPSAQSSVSPSHRPYPQFQANKPLTWTPFAGQHRQMDSTSSMIQVRQNAVQNATTNCTSCRFNALA